MIYWKNWPVNMLKKILFLLTILAASVPLSVLAQPVCPVCTVAVAGGVGLCRYLGISDLISGTWIGALLVLLVIWIIKWLNNKNIKFKFRKLMVIFLTYFFVIVPLYWVGFMGQAGHKFWGIDELLFGIITGSIVFLAAYIFENNFLRNKNGGKAYFPFQKVVIPISFLIIASLIFNIFC
jgi:uncharacterized membrane protein (UPF0136 family)